jgi:hypothetical protein
MRRIDILLTLLISFTVKFAVAQNFTIQSEAGREYPKVQDSLNGISSFFIGELKRALPRGYEIVQGDDGDIKLFLRSVADRNGIEYPTALKGYNSEGFYIKAGKKVVVVGNSALALQHASFAYLEQLGLYHQFPLP